MFGKRVAMTEEDVEKYREESARLGSRLKRLKLTTSAIEKFADVGRRVANALTKSSADINKVKKGAAALGEKIKDKVEDVLGYDEKERMEKASNDYKTAEKNAYGFQDYVGEQQNRATYYNQETDRLEYKSEGYKEHMRDLYEQQEEHFKAAREAGKKASQAAAEFYNTPLGKLEKTSSELNKIKKKVSTWLDNLFKKR